MQDLAHLPAGPKARFDQILSLDGQLFQLVALIPLNDLIHQSFHPRKLQGFLCALLRDMRGQITPLNGKEPSHLRLPQFVQKTPGSRSGCLAAVGVIPDQLYDPFSGRIVKFHTAQDFIRHVSACPGMAFERPVALLILRADFWFSDVMKEQRQRDELIPELKGMIVRHRL